MRDRAREKKEETPGRRYVSQYHYPLLSSLNVTHSIAHTVGGFWMAVQVPSGEHVLQMPSASQAGEKQGT